MHWFNRLRNWVLCLVSKDYRETSNMTASEYNQWLEDKRNADLESVKYRLSKVLPTAYKDHVDTYRMYRKPVPSCFQLRRGSYGLSRYDIELFANHACRIGRFCIRLNPYSFGPDVRLDISVEGI